MVWYWVSWVEHNPDYRPLNDPPNEAVIGWWKSGELADGSATLCALLAVPSFGHTEIAIDKDWPREKGKLTKPRQWRFHNHVPAGYDPGERFPMKEWVRERWEAARQFPTDISS